MKIKLAAHLPNLTEKTYNMCFHIIFHFSGYLVPSRAVRPKLHKQEENAKKQEGNQQRGKSCYFV